MMSSDPVTLNDLRRVERINPGHPAWEGVEPYRHPVTLDDLIQVLEGMGAKRMWLCEKWRMWAEVGNSCDQGSALGSHDPVEMGCGWYLVLPLPTPQEEG